MAILTRVLKWLGIILGVLVGIAVIGVAVVYVLIGRDLDRTFEREETIVEVPDDPAVIAEGERLARLRGCFGGCHGRTVNGTVFMEAPDGTKVVAPDLARAVRNYSVEELEKIIRHGIRPDGTSVIGIMPSNMLYHLSNDELGAIIAFLRTQAPGAEELPDTRVGPLGRLMFMYYRHMFGTILAAEGFDHKAPRIPPMPEVPAEHGRYLAHTVCTECHGNDLRGAGDGWTPTLAIVAAYSADDFRHLMRTGEAIGSRELGLMGDVARARFVHFTDEEIDALYEYLKAFATAET